MSAVAEAPGGVVADPLVLADDVIAAWGSLFMARRRRPGGGFEYLMTPLDEVRFLEPADAAEQRRLRARLSGAVSVAARAPLDGASAALPQAPPGEVPSPQASAHEARA